MHKNIFARLAPASFPARLITLLLVVATLLSAVGTYALHTAMHAFTEQTVDEELTALADTLHHTLSTHPQLSAQHSIDDLTHAWGAQHIAFRILQHPPFEAAATTYSISKAANWPIRWPVPDETGTTFQTVTSSDGTFSARILSRKANRPAGQASPQYTIQVAHSMGKELHFLARLQHLTILMAIATIIVLSCSGWLVAAITMRSIHRVTHAAEVMAGGVFMEDIPPSKVGNDVDRLIAAFNRSSRRLSALINELSQTNDHMAHDLKTPVTQIHAAAELLLQEEQSSGAKRTSRTEKLEDILEGSDMLLTIINTILDAAEINAGIRSVNRQPVPVSDLFQILYENYSPLAEAKTITLQVSPPLQNPTGACAHPAHSSPCVFADKSLLLRALANIVDNAIKFTPEGGTVLLSHSETPLGSTIHITDSGPGISTTDQWHIFKRLYRGDSSRAVAGNGLGLYIARSIIQAHGGDIRLTRRSHGEAAEQPPHKQTGATFSVSLPNWHDR